MSTTAKRDAAAFLAEFFSTPNRLNVTSKAEIPTWAERIRADDPLPTVLPCWRADDSVDWYALAFDDRQLRALGESLTAFIGPTYTTFRGQLANLDPADPIDLAVLRFTGGLAFKFRGAEPKEIWKALERMRKVWERRGPRERSTPEPVGRVLRDFFMALRASDAELAEQQLGRLRDQYHLDGVNLLYLRVQFLAELRKWKELLSLAELPDLLRLRRPVAVSEAVLRAVYNSTLVCFENPPIPNQAAAVFCSEVLPRFGAVFASRGGMQSPEAVKSFMLLAVTRSPADLTLRDELLALAGLPNSDEKYLRELAALAPQSSPTNPADPLPLAAEAALGNDFDRAFSLARGAVPSPARARLLCECALELGSIEAKALAVEAVNQLPAEDRQIFLDRRVNQQLWEGLQEEAHEQGEAELIEAVPTEWCSWLDHLDRHEGKKGSRELAWRGSSEWSVSDFLAHPGAVERFLAQVKSARSQAAEYVLRDCLPYLLAFFQKDSAWPNPAFRDVYRPLMDLLFFSTNGGRADLVLFNDLLEAVLGLGVGTTTDYGELVAYSADLWTRFAAPATLDWAAEALELFITYPCPESEARRGFFQSILDRSMTFLRYVEMEQRELLRLMASDLGASELFCHYFPLTAEPSAVEAVDPLAALVTMSVTVYTLTESAGRQFKAVLEARAPGVQVNLCHDLDASPRLRQLARQSDLFVVAVRSAKHAATDCIDSNRPEGKPTLRPSGKGAASMLRAVREYLANG